MATLCIDRFSSTCSECYMGADPKEEGHYTILGYGPDNGAQGCGAIFWDMRPEYYDGGKEFEDLKALRPDLPIVDSYRSPFIAPEVFDK